MLELTYDLPAPPRLEKLHDELVAAGLVVDTCRNAPGSVRVAIVVADGTAPSAVAAVVQAHDPTTPSVREQQAQVDRTNAAAALAALRSAVASWGSLSAGQKDTVLLHLAKAVVAVLDRG